MRYGRIDIPWHRFPLLRVVIALILGIITSSIISVPTSVYLSLSFLAITSCIVCHKVGVKITQQLFFKSVLLLVAVFFLGAARYSSETYSLPNNHYSHHLIDNGKQSIEALILERPKVRNRARTFVEVSSIIDGDGNYQPTQGKMVLYFLAEDSVATAYQPGDKVALQTSITPTLANTNPYAFDYKEYLHNRGVDYQGFVSSDRHTRVAERQLPIWAQLASDFRGHALQTIQDYMSGADEKAVVSAMLLGYRNNISSELYDSYTDTGVVHVLAVSGLHVGIVAGLLLYLLSFLTDKRLSTKVLKTVIVILILGAYVLVTGAAPAVVRAAIMFGLMLIASFLSNDLNVFNSLSLAAIAMLLVTTSMLFQASFQFSFLALTSIVFFQPYLVQLVSPKSKILDWMWQMITVAISAQILVFPLTIFYFHKFPLYFMLSSIIAIPAAVGIIYGGILLLAAAVIVPSAVTTLIGTLLSWWVWGFNKSIALINSLPGTVVDGIWFEPSTTILLYILIGLLMIFLAFDLKPQTVFAGLYVVLFMVVLSGFRSISRHHQAFMTIYDIYGGYAIDFVIDDKTYYVKDTSITDEKYHFAVFNNRIKHRANNPIALMSTTHDGEILADMTHGLIQVCDKQILLTGGSVPTSCTAVDVLIVTKSDELHPYTYLSTIDPTLIVIDSSLGWDQRKQWTMAAREYGSDLYAINRQGALTYNLRS